MSFRGADSPSTTSFPRIDYSAAIEWIWINGHWYPRQIAFVDLVDKRIHLIEPSDLSFQNLKDYSVDKDIKINNKLPTNPYRKIEQDGSYHYYVHIEEMKHYLQYFYRNNLMRSDGWEVNIGTTDMDTFKYLLPILPENRILYRGYDHLSAKDNAVYMAQTLSDE